MTTRSSRDEPRHHSRTPMSLLLRLQDGKEDDWRTFWGIYGPMVLGLAARRGLGPHDADDVLALVMHALVRMFRTGFQVDHEKGLFRKLVATLTYRTAATHHRRRRRSACALDVAGEVAADALLPDEELSRAERLARLRLCLERLRNDRKVRRRDLIAFERVALGGEPVTRVAKDLDITPAYVHLIKHRMLKRISGLMRELELEFGEV